MNDPEYCTLEKAQRLERELAEARQKIDGLIIHLGEKERELDRLREIEGRLPKTADGAHVLPGDPLWLKQDDGGLQCVRNMYWMPQAGWVARFEIVGPDRPSIAPWREVPVDRLYSTEEAARQARREVTE